MTKKFTQSIFILLVLNLLVKPFWVFGVDRTIQNTVGAEQYGLYFSLFSFSLLFNMLADLGITNYNNRNIAQHHHLIAQQVGRVLPLKLILGVLYTILTIVAALFSGYEQHQVVLLFWLTINQVLISGTQYLRSNIAGLQLFKTDSFVSILDKLLLVLICSYLLWWPSDEVFKIEWLIYAQTVAYTSSFFIALIIVIKKSEKVFFNLKLKNSLVTIKHSFPFAVLIFLMVFYTRIDAVMLERMLPDGKTQVGIYAQGFRIFDALSMIPYLFASILLPLFAKMIKENFPIKETLSHSFSFLIIPSLGLMTALLFYTKEFMQLLYYEHIGQSSEILGLLIIGFIGIAATYIFGTLLTAAGKLKKLNRIALSALVLNILLNAALIPSFGATGAAFSSALTQLGMGIAQGIISIGIFKIKIHPNTYIKYTAFLLVLFIVSFAVKKFIEVWYLGIMLIAISSLLLGFSAKILKKKHFKALLYNEPLDNQ